MNITFVKKIKEDGQPCQKCAEVESRLENDGYMEMINQTIIADERDPQSEGMQLAEKFSVDRAPFFVVEDEGKDPEIYTVYFKFVKEVLNQDTNEKDAARELMDSNPDLDFL